MLKWIIVGLAAVTAVGGILMLEPTVGPASFVVFYGGMQATVIAALVWCYKNLVKMGGRKRTAAIATFGGGFVGYCIYAWVIERREKKRV